MMEERAEALLAQLVDIEALKHLKARYCHCVDARAWDELAPLWTEDAVCDYGFFGCYQGRQAIMDGFFRGAVDSVCSFMAHMVHNPLIEVSGDTAKAKWYLTAQTTIQPANQAVWVMGIYDDRFVRQDGEWKISSLVFEFKYYTPFEEGWAKIPIWEIPT